MLKIFGLFCVTCAIIAGDVKADQLGQLREEYNNVVKECMAEYPLTQADIEALGTKKTTENVNCMFACALKKSGMMDDNGNLSVEGVRKSTEKYLSNDSELLKKSEMFTDACKSVNDVPVSDGKKGCERASLIFQCSIEKAPSALTEEEMKAELTKLIMKCTKDHPVDMSELVLLQQLVVPKKKETKCLLACAYKTEGIMTAKGLYDIEHAYKIAELGKNGDEKRLENGKKMADVCVKVNDIEVSDGEKGCERAGLIFKCTLENAPKFGFKV